MASSPSKARLRADEPARARVTVRGLAQLPISAFADWDRVWQIRQVLVAFEGGANFNEAALLADGMFRDDRIFGVCSTRASAVAGSDVEFRGADSRRKAGKIAEELGGSDEHPGMWDTICPPWVAAEMVVWGFMLGIAVAEIVWDTSDPAKWIPRLRVWHPQFLRYDWNSQRYFLQTGERQDSIVELPNVEENPRSDGHWVIWCPYGYRNVWRRALIRPLSMPYLLRQWASRDWARYSEKHGQPTDVLKVPEGAPEEEKAAISNQLAARGSDATVTLPQGLPNEPGYGLDLLEAQADTYGTFRDQLSKLETDIAVCVLGQNLTTEVQGGSRAAAQVHDNVRLDKLREDARIATCLREQVLSHWAEYNYGDVGLTPRVRYVVDPPEDELQEAQTLEAVGAALTSLQLAGVAVDVDAVADSYGIPREDDEVDATTGEPIAPAPSDITLTPSAVSAITKVNEARAAVGLGPLLTESGAPDPDGDLTVAEYQARHAVTVAAAAEAEAGAQAPASEGAPGPADAGTPAPPNAGAPVGANGRASAGANAGTSADAMERARVGASARALDLQASADLLARRASRQLRAAAKEPGRKRMQRYADALQRLARERGRQAMKADLAEIMAEVDKAGGDLKALRRRIIARYKDRMTGAALARVIERANIMAHLAGQQGALEDL